MKTLVPYFTFAGNCREAMQFYKQCLNGEIVQMQTFEEAKYQTSDKFKNRIIHAEFKAEGVHLMASDGMEDFVAVPGNNLSLNIDLTDEKEQARIFAALSQGGKVAMPLQDTFWGAKYGQLVDRFGIQWMLNCTKPVAEPMGQSGSQAQR
jgi:PhnB protein